MITEILPDFPVKEGRQEGRNHLSTLLNSIVYGKYLKGETFNAADHPLLQTHLWGLCWGLVSICSCGLSTY